MVTFTPASPVTPVQPPNTVLPFVMEKTGLLTIPANQQLQQMWARVSGGSLPIVCACQQDDVNILVLTPLSTSPRGMSFFDFASVRFIAAATSTGTLTAVVANLGSLPVYKARGNTVADSGDIVALALYELVYASHLNSNTGGLIIV